MSWFALALVAMLCWSGSDLFSKMGSKPDDRLSHWKMVMAVGLVMGLHALYTVVVGGVRVTVGDMITYLPASFLYILAMVLGYVGLRYIELSISSPICNTSGAAAALFALCGGRESYYGLLDALARTREIRMTSEQVESYAGRWAGLKNFSRTPGGFTPEEAAALYRELFVK